MTDIVQELREAGRWLRKNWQERAGDTCMKAADEIEQLRFRLQRIQGYARSASSADCVNINAPIKQIKLECEQALQTKDTPIAWPDDAKRCANCFERSVVNIDSVWHCLNCGVTEKGTDGTMRNLAAGQQRCKHGYESDRLCPYCDGTEKD